MLERPSPEQAPNGHPKRDRMISAGIVGRPATAAVAMATLMCCPRTVIEVAVDILIDHLDRVDVDVDLEPEQDRCDGDDDDPSQAPSIRAGSAQVGSEDDAEEAEDA